MAKTYYVISESQYEYLNSKKPLQSESEPVEDFVSLLPPRLQAKGRTLLNVLQIHKNVSIKPDGSLVFNGNHLEGTHIADLLTLALSHGYRKRCAVRGFKEFAHLVKAANVPRYLLSSTFIEAAKKCL